MSDDTLRDERQTGYFIIENVLFDEYASEIGVYGIAVYCLLVKMANSEKKAWPSYNYIAKTLGMSRPKAIKTVAQLIELGLIKVEEQFSPTPDGNTVNKSNRYTIKNIRRGGKPDLPGGKPDLPGVVNEDNQGGKRGLPEQVPNEQHPIEKESSENVALLMDSTSRECVALLVGAKTWNKNQSETAELITELRAKYPTVNAVEVCEDFEFALRNGAKYKVPASGLRTYFKNAAKWAKESAAQGPRRIRSKEL